MDIILELEEIESNINKDIRLSNKTNVFDELPDFDKGRVVGMADLSRRLKENLTKHNKN